jgi:hypothetical protein
VQGIDAGGCDKMQPAPLIDAIILAGFFIEGDRKTHRVSARVWHGSPFQIFEDEQTHVFVHCAPIGPARALALQIFLCQRERDHSVDFGAGDRLLEN